MPGFVCTVDGLILPKQIVVALLIRLLVKEGQKEKYHLQCYVDVHEKGKAKLRDNFESKLYDCFYDLRFELLL